MRADYNYDDWRALAHHHHIIPNPNHFLFFFSFSFQFFIQFVVAQDHKSIFSFFFFSILLFNPWWVITTNSFLLFFPIFSFFPLVRGRLRPPSFSFFFSIFSKFCVVVCGDDGYVLGHHHNNPIHFAPHLSLSLMRHKQIPPIISHPIIQLL